MGVWFRQLLLINGNGGKQGSLKIINTCLLVCVWASVCDFYDCGDMYHRQLSSPNPFGRKQTNLLKERLGPVLSPSNQTISICSSILPNSAKKKETIHI